MTTATTPRTEVFSDRGDEWDIFPTDQREQAPQLRPRDVYTRVTNRIIDSLEQGVRPWLKPWNASFAAGRITRPLRFNGEA